MNLGAYVARTGADENLEDTLVNLLANNGKSSKYDSVKERLYHTRGAVAYAKSTERLSFSCNAMRSLLSVRPCDGCVLETKGASGDDDDDMGAIARDNGYYNMTAAGALRRMTNFILQPEEVLNEIQQDGTITRRKATRTKVVKNSEVMGMVVLGEETFASRSSFIKSLEGVTGIVFEGSDSDVQRIKKTFDDAAADVGEIMLTYTCGILIDQVNAGEGNSVEVRTYVEPHHSINSVKRTNTHSFQGKLTHKAHLFEAAMPTENDEVMDYALWNLLQCSTPETVATLIGWHVACHFKAHLMRRFQQFPLLSLWGNAGAGKSMTSSLYTWLNGTDYHGMGMDSGVNLTSITEYALREYVSNVTTIPRVLEEFNKSKIQQQSRSMYTTIHEMIKAAWGGETVLRGTLGGGRSKGRTGANVIETNITAPLIVISEQRLDTDAIRQRSIRIELTEKKREGRKHFYEEAKFHREKLRVFGKALMFKALTTESMEVYEWINSYADSVPPKLQDRPRYSLQVVLMGLQICAEVMEKLGLPKSLEMLTECRTAFDRALKREDKIERPKSEVDGVICDIGLLVTLNNPLLRDTNNRATCPVQLQENVDYLVEYPFVFLDPILIHAKYIQYYKLTRGQQPVIDTSDQFSLLLRQESYFEEEVEHPGWLTHRNVFRLSIPKMGEKNIDQSLFTPVKEVQW
jgi:PII-like signaling protein